MSVTMGGRPLALDDNSDFIPLPPGAIPRREPRKFAQPPLARMVALGEASKPIEPMQAPEINLATVLDAVEYQLRRFVHFSSEEQSWAIALWVAHTYALDASDQSPRLAIRAPTRQSGKTRLLEVLAELCCRAWYVVGPSPAVVYRKIDRDHPTILLDEADRLFEKRAEDIADLVQLVNAGHVRGAVVPRVLDARSNKLKDWPAYGALALAGIGTLWPDTVMDRSIVITLERKQSEDEPVERFGRHVKWFPEGLGKELGDVVTAAVTGTLECRNLPPELSDRAQDNWEPLLAIAELAGSHWPDRARRAAIALSGPTAVSVEVEDDRPELIALRDVRATFEVKGDPEFLPTSTLLLELKAMAESPWDEEPKLTAHRLGKLLRTFKVHSEQPGRGALRGYWLRDIEKAWKRLRTSDASLISIAAPVAASDRDE